MTTDGRYRLSGTNPGPARIVVRPSRGADLWPAVPDSRPVSYRAAFARRLFVIPFPARLRTYTCPGRYRTSGTRNRLRNIIANPGQHVYADVSVRAASSVVLAATHSGWRLSLSGGAPISSSADIVWDDDGGGDGRLLLLLGDFPLWKLQADTEI